MLLEPRSASASGHLASLIIVRVAATTIIEKEVGIFIVDNKALCHNEDELSAITFGSCFGGITDIETRPDGSLYVHQMMTSMMITLMALSMKFRQLVPPVGI